MHRSSEFSPGNRERIHATRVFRRVLSLAERQWGVIADWQLALPGEPLGDLALGGVGEASPHLSTGLRRRPSRDRQ
jgi:hypothetical protein